MIYLIIEYIEHALKVEPRRITKAGRKIYHSEAVSLLEKVFRLDEYEADGYLIAYILGTDPDFDYVFWKNSYRPEPIPMPDGRLFYLDFVYGGGDDVVLGV